LNGVLVFKSLVANAKAETVVVLKASLRIAIPMHAMSAILAEFL
jgi:hypothetical protein